ncbi:pheromone A receptor-domain-containing protein [Mycena belliarum]|uniref:Pheromone A receptor-domain-containing protein n=1 Tax=Mycena belliarum TaxID=1033014 RepID=A0AAD6XMU0_9AGAR|nr:pheromone A receptor-domain-containing protein [Mycena belliae]
MDSLSRAQLAFFTPPTNPTLFPCIHDELGLVVSSTVPLAPRFPSRARPAAGAPPGVERGDTSLHDVACLNQFVNSVVRVRADDMLNRATGWCDSELFSYPYHHGRIPAASLCISRRLLHIASAEAGSVSSSRTDKRRAVLVDTPLCVLLPLVYLALQYIVQTHRFALDEQLGCVPALALANSIPTPYTSSPSSGRPSLPASPPSTPPPPSAAARPSPDPSIPTHPLPPD